MFILCVHHFECIGGRELTTLTGLVDNMARVSLRWRTPTDSYWRHNWGRWLDWRPSMVCPCVPLVFWGTHWWASLETWALWKPSRFGPVAAGRDCRDRQQAAVAKRCDARFMSWRRNPCASCPKAESETNEFTGAKSPAGWVIVTACPRFSWPTGWMISEGFAMINIEILITHGYIKIKYD